MRQVVDLYIGRGFNIIIGTSYGFGDGLLEAAKAKQLLGSAAVSSYELESRSIPIRLAAVLNSLSAASAG